MIMLNLPPEKETLLKAQAQAHGLSIEQWFLQLAEEAASLTMHGSPDTWEEEFEEWLAGIPETPPLSDDAINRASLYPDRW